MSFLIYVDFEINLSRSSGLINEESDKIDKSETNLLCKCFIYVAVLQHIYISIRKSYHTYISDIT